jgi:hypothetical protein
MTPPLLRARGQQVVVVSSGAVALGRRRLGLTGSKSLTLPEKQAAAAAGQSLLMRAWEEAFEPHDIGVAQILMTRDDTETRRRWLNARATVETLLSLGVVPVVNENDTVVTEEIRYGDNDRLAARVAQLAAPTCWSCCPTSTASTPPIRAAIPTPRTWRRSRRSRRRSKPWPAARTPPPASAPAAWPPRSPPPASHAPPAAPP